MSVAIKIENLSKQYRLGLVSTRTLSHDLNRWWQTSILGREDPYLKIGQENRLSGGSQNTSHRSEEYVWALKDINLEVEEGEVLGIIGKNGAGKSTLLKILSKVTAPTTGIVKARGRIASLLEVGTGFHQEMTGRENIYMNGAIMGMTKAEIRKKFDEIVEFAGVEKYIDTPVKRYSSGMTVRLGFAVAAHLEPEILVVDEVLAVGDAEFQKKAVGKMQEVSHEKGRTVLFVSHNMGAVNTLCNSGILLNLGVIENQGDVSEVINSYIIKSNRKNTYYAINENKDIYFKEIYFKNINNYVTNSFVFNQEFKICFVIGINKFHKNSTLSFKVLNSKMIPLFTNHYLIKDSDQLIEAKVPSNLLLPGKYFTSFGIHIPNVQYFDLPEDYLSFNIEDTGNQNTPYSNVDQGSLNINISWKSKKLIP